MNQPRVASWRSLQAATRRTKHELRALARSAPRMYEPFDILLGDKTRHIDNPKAELLEVQRCLLLFLRKTCPLDKSAHGGVPGRSPLTNASSHQQGEIVARADIKNCFPSISHKMVYNALTKRGFSPDLASITTKLTTLERRLPQGAPTSTHLANLVIADAIEGVAGTPSVTTFVDDIAMSGEREDVTRSLFGVLRAIRAAGLKVRAKKVELQAAHRGYVAITGVGVRVPGVAPKKRKRLRTRLLALERQGTSTEAEWRSIVSTVAHVKSLNADQGHALERLASRVQKRLRLLPGGRKSTKTFVRCCSTKKHRA